MFMCSRDKVLQRQSTVCFECAEFYEKTKGFRKERESSIFHLTLITRPKLVGHHGVDHELDIAGVRVACAGIHGRLVCHIIGSMARLKHIKDASHVPLGEFEERRLPVLRDINVFCLNNRLQALLHLGHGKGRKSKAGTAGLDGRDDLVHVVADYAEADVACVLLDHPS